MKGLILAAPGSGAGKTTVTLALLRLLRRNGVSVRGAKSGPDYIDPRFHAAACGAESLNLDAWSMRRDRLLTLARRGPQELLIIEGAMGLFDGAPPEGRGAVADLARAFDLPVVLVVDAGKMAQSIAPLVAGFARFDPDVTIGGVILNCVGSARHESMLHRALAPLGLPVLGCLPRKADLALPERHLGLVQAEETPELEAFLENAATCLAEGFGSGLDLQGVLDLARLLPEGPEVLVPPPAQRIAMAQDEAFAFSYPHQLGDWQLAGAEVIPFSPLVDDAVPEADLVYLPGGYPELHAGRLAANQRFLSTLRSRAETAQVYGECGGYMVLGEGLVDADGKRHQMAGLLGLETSFAKRRLNLGYRSLEGGAGPFAGPWRGHEFHYASTLSARGQPLFSARDAEGTQLPPIGLRNGGVCGSFAHLIEPE
ncbi:cobyrinate a,c-diamide synthase [Pseudooceanicola sp. HF7]|uniref:cobyrinate a,c-diamide synthase n=1 Tax=Pseudooceanicola sp. HF7 TaxID=2721560 RepID=UPI0014306B29|nr:cobyrinate a,c-diamide synthase [Pseudooceanicola sp. HF7]NIZ10808.1 cobyrinate a,c-diamide synthase [Pseudooceanicola sp. HF7]